MMGLKHRNISHLSCRALVAVMVLSGWSSVGGIGEALGLKSTDKSCITALESANARLNLDAPITRQRSHTKKNLLILDPTNTSR